MVDAANRKRVQPCGLDQVRYPKPEAAHLSTDRQVDMNVRGEASTPALPVEDKAKGGSEQKE